MTVSSLNKTRYSSFDFNTHVDDLRSRLQLKFAADFNDFSLSSMGIVLLDTIAYGLDSLSFYLDRRASEAYLETARTRKGVARLTRQLGYKMSPAVASSVDVMVRVTEAFPFTIPIRKGFQFLGPEGLVFEASQDIEFAPAEQGPNSAFKSIACYQGRTVSELFVSDGSPNQVFELARIPERSFVVGGSVELSVDGAPFEEKEFLTFETSDHFELGYNDSPPTIKFGDGVAGNIPKEGATIDVTYITSRGKIGRVSRNSIDDVVNPLVVNFATIPLEVNNPEGSVGGGDPETLSQAKIFAPRVFKTRDVAVTREDYESLSESYADPLFGRVAVAQAISARSVENDLSLLNILAYIRSLVTEPRPTVEEQVSEAQQSLDLIESLMGGMGSVLGSLVDLLLTANTNVEQSVTTSKALRNKSLDIVSDTQDIQSRAGSVKITIDSETDIIDEEASDSKGLVEGISEGGSDELTSATKGALIEALGKVLESSGKIAAKSPDLTNITTQAAAISNSGVGIQTDSESVIAFLGVARQSLEEAGLDVSDTDTEVGRLEESRVAVVDTLPLIGDNLLVIDSAVTDVSSAVETELGKIRDHVDALLSQDCKANLVTVPILSRDLGGFLAAPSNGLIQSLQRFLDERKEVTQTVAVTSGEDFLVPVVISLNIGVFPQFSEAVARTDTLGVVEGIIRDQRFGQSLFESEICCEVKKLEAVAHVNVDIKGNLENGVLVTSRLDGKGNMLVGLNEIITKGEITIQSSLVKS